MIREGYQQTAIGLIPCNWEAVNLGDIGECIIGLTYKPENVKESGLLVLRSSNIKENTLRFDDNVFVDIEVSERIKTQEGDILVCVRNGSRNLIGKTAIIDSNSEGLTFGAFMSVYRTKYFNYIFHLFQSNILKRQIQNNLGATINQITNKDLNSFIIPLPPLPEQKAIAEVLGDVDRLINTCDKLIAKKRDIKQGAMQELLTGRSRLPGFSGEWEVKKLGDVVNGIIGGGTPRREKKGYWNGNIFWATVKDFSSFNPNCTEERISLEGLKSSASNLIPKGTLIISTRMAVGKAVIYDVDVAINQDLKAIFVKPNLDTKFLFYWFIYNSSNLQNLGSGSTVKGIVINDLKNIDFYQMPLEEQKAIAQILSDMDSEIEALEKKRDKYKLIKQGMMQELLTGKTRLL